MLNWIKKHYPLLISLAAAGGLLWFWFPALRASDVGSLVQLTAEEFYSAIGKATVIIAILQFGLVTWVKVRIEESVKHDNAKKLEDYRNDIKIREQASKIAELLAHARWNQGIHGEIFDRKAWELSLWLPTDICCQLTVCLAEKRDIDSIKKLLIEVRKLLLKDKAGDLIAANILHTEIVEPLPKA